MPMFGQSGGLLPAVSSGYAVPAIGFVNGAGLRVNTAETFGLLSLHWVSGSGVGVSSGGASVGGRLTFGTSVWNSQEVGFERLVSGVLALRGATSTAGGALNFAEQSAPATPAADQVTLYAADSGGTTVLRYVDSTGTVRTITAT